MGENNSAEGLVVLLVVVVGLCIAIWGIATMASANFSNPINGLQQTGTGLVATGVGATLVLVALGAAGVVAVLLSFLIKAGRRGL